MTVAGPGPVAVTVTGSLTGAGLAHPPPGPVPGGSNVPWVVPKVTGPVAVACHSTGGAPPLTAFTPIRRVAGTPGWTETAPLGTE